nr:restriction endonuclease subunit S [uncultured Neisseria sp.]
MNRYERYKDSGIPWLGEVPEHWEIVPIRHLFQFKNNLRVPLSAEERGKIVEKIYPYYGASGIIDYVDNFIFDEDLILVAEDGANLLSRSTPLAFIATGKYWVNNHAHILKPLSRIIKFWQYLLQIYDFSPLISGSAQPKLTKDNLASILLPSPTVEEQTAIAHYLDTKLGEIDALIDKQQTLLEKLAEQRTAVITHAVTKGLDPAAPMKKSGVEWLGDVPAHWDVKRLKFLITELRVGPFGSAIKISDYVQDGKPLYNQRTVLDNSFVNNSIFITDEKYKELNSFQTKSGDFLLTTRGTIGKVAIVPENAEPGIIHPCLIRFKIDENLVLPKLLKSIFNETDFFKKQLDLQSNATTIDVIYSNSLKELFLALPPRDEQTAITDYLDQETAKIDRLCETVNQTIGRLKEYRTALITQAVTGKIKVTDE